MMRERDANSVFSKGKLGAGSSPSPTLFLPRVQNGGRNEREGKIIRVGAGRGRAKKRKSW